MKKILFYSQMSLAIFAMSSCSDYVENVSNSDYIMENARSMSRSVEIANPGLAYFDSVCAPELWQQHTSLMEMQEALDLPQSLLEELTTEQLAECCIKYPLNINYMAFNNVIDGVNSVIEGFNGYKELLGRQDYATSLINEYEALSRPYVNTGAQAEVDDVSEKFERVFLENILLSDYYPEVFAGLNAQRLRSIAIGNILMNKTTLDKTPNNTTNNIIHKIDSKEASTQSDVLGTNNVYTLFGTPVQVFIVQEMDNDEITRLNSKYTALYPNAEYLGSATNSYNCHYYAWAMRDNPQPYWMNYYKGTSGANVSLYWTNDEYCSGSSSNYSNIYYDGNDHSARKSSVSGKVESKWGKAPLMRHDIGYCPYANGATLKYYRKFDFVGTLTTSYGIGETTVGSVDNYYISNSSVPINRMTYEWVIETAKGDDAVENGTAIIRSKNGSSASIEFTRAGLYEIYLNGYNYKGESVLRYGFEPIVCP